MAVEVSGGSRTLYISGQIPIAPDGSVADSALEQCRQAWSNIVAQLRAADMGVDNIVKITTILPAHAFIPASRTARAEAIGDRRPASTLIVAGLANPAWNVEIEVIACA
jgi:enamine deaminase RidA (YjgF/YER057c/UK114 family)